MATLKRAAQDFPLGEYEEAARVVFEAEVEKILMPLLVEAFEGFVAGLRRIQTSEPDSDPKYLARKLMRDVIRARIEPVLALAIREAQLADLDRRQDERSVEVAGQGDALLDEVLKSLESG